jgi:hypothetical protein
VVDIKSPIINTIEKQETKMEIHKIENGVIVEINGKPVNEAPKAAKPKKEIKVEEVIPTPTPNEEVKLEDSANTEATAGSNEE